MSWLLFTCVVTNNGGYWPMYMHDPQHSAYSTSSMPTCLEKSWEHSKSNSPDSTGGVRFIASDKKLIAVQHPFVYSLDMNDGSLLWEISQDDISVHVPAAAQGRVCIGMYEGILCLDIHTGEILWKYKDAHVYFHSHPIVLDGRIIIGSWDGFFDYFGPDQDAVIEDAARKKRRVLCLDTETGEVIWEFHAHGIIGDASPACADGRVFINDGDGTLYCLDAETGTLIWEKEMEGFSDSSPSVDDERVFVGTLNRMLNCHSRKTGDILWKFDSKAPVYTEPALGYGRVYFGSQNGIFYCLDAETGHVLWKIETGLELTTPLSRIFLPAVIADRKVAFGTRNGELYIVDAFSGEIINSYHLKKGISSFFLSDGKFFVGGSGGEIICFEKSSCYQRLNMTLLIGSLAVGLLLVVWYRMKRTRKR